MSIFQIFATDTLRSLHHSCLTVALCCVFAVTKAQVPITVDEISQIRISEFGLTNAKGKPKTDVAYRNVNFEVSIPSLDPTIGNFSPPFTMQMGDGTTRQFEDISAANRFSHRYSSSGIKSLRITDATGFVLLQQNLTVRPTDQNMYRKPDRTIAVTGDYFTPPCPNAFLPQIRDRASGQATGKAHIRFANNNTSGKIKKPFIFVEGIDFGNEIVTDPQTGGKIRTGDFGWDIFVQGISEKAHDSIPDGWQEIMRNAPTFLSDMTRDGFDVLLYC